MRKIILPIFCGLLGAEAFAAQSDWYVGAGCGEVCVHGWEDEVVTPGASTTTTAPGPDGTTITGTAGGDTTSVIVNGKVQARVIGADPGQSRVANYPVRTFTGTVGYHLSPCLAIEADYEQPEEIRTVTALTDSFSIRSAWEVENLGISVVGSYPLLPRIRLLGGAGIGSSWSKVRSVYDFGNGADIALVPATISSQLWRAQLRAGIEFAATQKLAVRVGWDRPDENLRTWRGYNSEGELTLDSFTVILVWCL